MADIQKPSPDEMGISGKNPEKEGGGIEDKDSENWRNEVVQEAKGVMMWMQKHKKKILIGTGVLVIGALAADQANVDFDYIKYAGGELIGGGGPDWGPKDFDNLQMLGMDHEKAVLGYKAGEYAQYFTMDDDGRTVRTAAIEDTPGDEAQWNTTYAYDDEDRPIKVVQERRGTGSDFPGGPFSLKDVYNIEYRDGKVFVSSTTDLGDGIEREVHYPESPYNADEIRIWEDGRGGIHMSLNTEQDKSIIF